VCDFDREGHHGLDGRAYPPRDGGHLEGDSGTTSIAAGRVRISRFAGEGQGEGMLRALLGVFRPGDVLLADRLMCEWTEMVMLKPRGVDTVTRLGKRTADFRRGGGWETAITSSAGPSRGSRGRSTTGPNRRSREGHVSGVVGVARLPGRRQGWNHGSSRIDARHSSRVWKLTQAYRS
jgi:hypothetical protein